MNFFADIEQTQIIRRLSRPADYFVPHHRRLFAIHPSAREVARAAVREVLG
jgi:hypothetical protein